MYRKILVPLDGSELAERVVPHVQELAKCTGAQVVLLRVANVPVLAYSTGDVGLANSARENVESEAYSYLEGIKARLGNAGVSVVLELGGGNVAETIVDCAANDGVDLIAMSTHGRGGLARLMLGSVADRVIRTSTVPVLLVHSRST